MTISRSRILIGILLCVSPAAGAAQDLTPRAYFPAPETSNVVILTYALSKGELVFDPTLPITDATGTIHTPVVSVVPRVRPVRPIGQRHRLAAVCDRQSERQRSPVNRARSPARGIVDANVRLAVNLVGGPSLSAAEFVKTPISRALLGASVKIVAPTGQYDPTRLINIGANRWAFKPELGYTGRTGKFVIDAFAGIWLFTANQSFAATAANPLGVERTQDPIGAFEFHVSYDVKPRLWVSADINYWRGGRTSVNGVEGSQTLQANSRFGVTGSVPLTRRQSFKISYSDGVIVRIGGNFQVLSVGLPVRLDREAVEMKSSLPHALTAGGERCFQMPVADPRSPEITPDFAPNVWRGPCHEGGNKRPK